MKNQMNRIKIAFITLLIVSVGTFGASTYVSAAGQTKRGCTNRSYGQFRVTKYTKCEKIDFWMRTYYNGGWHYWTDYFVNDISDKAVHKVKYCDKQKEYYQKGVRANLRAENAKSTVSIFKNRIKVSGVVRFN